MKTQFEKRFYPQNNEIWPSVYVSPKGIVIPGAGFCDETTVRKIIDTIKEDINQREKEIQVYEDCLAKWKEEFEQ